MPRLPTLWHIAAGTQKSLAARVQISGFRIDVEARDPSLEARSRSRIALQHARIVPRDDVLRRGCEPLDRVVAVEHLAHIVGDGKSPPALDVGIKMRGVGGEHDGAALRLDADALQALRVPADLVHKHARRDL